MSRNQQIKINRQRVKEPLRGEQIKDAVYGDSLPRLRTVAALLSTRLEAVWIVLNLHCNCTRRRCWELAGQFWIWIVGPMMDRPFVRGADDTSQMYPPHPFRTKPLAGDYRLSACTHRLSADPFFPPAALPSCSSFFPLFEYALVFFILNARHLA